MSINKNLGVYDIREFGATGNGSTDDYSAFSLAVSTLSSAGGTIVVSPGTYKIGTNLTFPANITVSVKQGAMLLVLTGVTVTFNGPLDAGADQIFTLNGTAAINGALLVDKVYAHWWGLSTSAAGATNSVAIENAMKTGKQVFIPKGTYIVTTGITVKGSQYPNITLMGEEGTVLDGTSSTAAYSFTLGGALSTSAALGANVVKGAVSITTTLASSLTKNDLILIKSTDMWNNGPVAVTFRKGEFAEVESINGNIITLKSQLFDGYTASTTTVYKIAPARVHIENIEMLRNSLNAAIWVEYTRNSIISRCRVFGARERALYASYSFNINFHNNHVGDILDITGGTNYGIAIATCQKVQHTDNYIIGGRHGFTHGGFEPTREVIAKGNYVDNYHQSGQACFDFHENCEHIIVSNNIIKNGFVYNGNNLMFTDNIVFGEYYTAVRIRPYLDNNDYIIIKNNRIDNTNTTNPSSSLAIYLEFPASNKTIEYLEISGNIIRSGVTHAIVFDGDSGGVNINNKIKRVVLKDNDVLVTGSAYAFYMHQANANNLPMFEDFLIEGGSYITPYATMHLETKPLAGNRLRIRDVLLQTTDQFNSPLDQVSGFEHVDLLGNQVVGNTSSKSPGIVLDGATRVVRLLNNRFENLNNTNISATGATEVHDIGNSMINCVGTPLSIGASTRKITNSQTSGIVQSYGISAPTTGTWKTGDRVLNSVPATGSPQAWLCTANGTPGTWIPITTGGSTNLAGLIDVDVTTVSPIDGNSLVYNAGKWKPGIVSGGGTSGFVLKTLAPGETVTIVDTTPPLEVTNITVSAITATGATLSWSASASTDIAEYDIYNGANLLGTTTTINYNVTGLTVGTAYTLTIKGKDTSGNVSTGVNAPTFNTAPAPVTSLTAGTPVADTVPLSWTLSASSTVSKQEVAYSSNGGTNWTVPNSNIAANATSYTVIGLASSTLYTFRVTAIDAAGSRSTGTTTTATTAVTSVTMLASDSFNRADSIALNAGVLGSTDSAYGGTAKAWTCSFTGCYGISGNQAKKTSDGSLLNHIANIDVGVADYKVSMMGAVHNDEMQLVARFIDDDHYIAIVDMSTSYAIRRKQAAGQYVTLATINITPTAGDILTLDCRGSSITGSVNGAGSVTVTETQGQTATKVGFYLGGDQTKLTRVDDFKVVQ